MAAGQAHPAGRPQGHPRPAAVRAHLSSRVLRLGGSGRRRALLFRVRARRSVQEPRRPSVPGRLPGARHRDHRPGHLRGVHEDHRALPARGRRVCGRVATPRSPRRRDQRLRSPHRLRADHDHLGRGRRRGGLQQPSGPPARLEAARRGHGPRAADHPESERGQGIHPGPPPHLPALRRHACHPHHRQRRTASGPGRRGGPRGDHRTPPRLLDHGRDGGLAPVPSRLLARRRYVHRVEGKTMNWTLAQMLAGNLRLFGLPLGNWFVVATLASEALLLFVAAQAGFIAGPRVMANLAHDSYLPHRLSALSDRLTMQNGVLLMGGASLFMLVYTRGSVDALVVMYSINVFVTFSLSQAGMIRYWLRRDTQQKFPDWRSSMAIAVACFVLCSFILVINVFEKFFEGAWLTVVVTGALIIVCLVIKRHYRSVFARLKRLDTILEALPTSGPLKELHIEKRKPTAVLLVASFSGLGIHSLLTVVKLFPRYFHNVVFMSVAVVDSATFQGVEEVDRVREETETALQKYVDLARRMGIPADFRMSVGTEAVAECERLATEVAREYERSIFFAGKLIFERERWWDRLLHNETAYQIQRRLQFKGLPMVVLPVRVLEE